VLCVDETSQIQALNRTQPGAPMKKSATMTHDYKRNGTTTLFAALNEKTGEDIGDCLPRHRAKELIRFLTKIDRSVADNLNLRLHDHGSTSSGGCSQRSHVRKSAAACSRDRRARAALNAVKIGNQSLESEHWQLELSKRELLSDRE
jgi:hypothetical protein